MSFKIECEVWSRTSGYFRPVAQYNPGKKEEFRQRKFIKTKELINGLFVSGRVSCSECGNAGE